MRLSHYLAIFTGCFAVPAFGYMFKLPPLNPSGWHAAIWAVLMLMGAFAAAYEDHKRKYPDA